MIIPHYNDADRLERCLAALDPQVGPNVDVIVVDNASTVPLDHLAARYPFARLVTEASKGAAQARNRGVAETAAPQLFFLDCDCIPDPDWVARAVTAADRGDLVGGAIRVFDETSPPRSGAEAFETVFAFDNRRYVETKGFSVTANLLTRRAVFDAVGGFRPGLSEDFEWCQRAGASGFTLTYADEVRVSHPTRSDWPALERKWRRLTQETWGLRGRGPADRLKWALRGLAMLGSIPAHAPRVLASPKLDGVGERWRGLGTLARIRARRCGWMLWQALGGRI